MKLRKKQGIALSLGAAIIMAPPALAAETLSSPAATAAAATASGNSAAAPASGKKAVAKRYCMNVNSETDTRVRRMACKTREQWADEGVEIDSTK